MLAARDAAKLEQASAAIPGSSWVQIDMTSPESIKEAFAKAGKAALEAAFSLPLLGERDAADTLRRIPNAWWPE